MSVVETPPVAAEIDAVLCVDDLFYARYQAVLRYLCVGLIDHIAGVRIVTTARDAESLTLGPVQTVLHRPLRWPMRGRRLQQLIETLAPNPPAVVHAMSSGCYLLAETIAREFDAAVICQVMSADDAAALRPPIDRTRRRVICASEPLLRMCSPGGGPPPDDVVLIRPGVATAGQPTCFRGDARQPTILCTAPLTTEDGVDRLLQAIHLLKGAGHPFITFLLGAGPREPYLRRQVSEYGLGAEVVFAQPQGNLLQAMEGADIFILPAVEHYLSLRCLQALAQGMAVVAMGGGVGDACRPNETAVVCETATAGAIVAAVERLLRDRPLARTLATNALGYMKAHHTRSAMVDRTAAVYLDLVLQHATIPLPAAKPGA